MALALKRHIRRSEGFFEHQASLTCLGLCKSLHFETQVDHGPASMYF